MSTTPDPETARSEKKAWEARLIRTVAGYLTEENYRFTVSAEDCLELHLQGRHLTMRMIIYAHNRHLVIRVPGFIRNQELRGRTFLLKVMAVMNEYFDIRFELSDDGQSLSGCSNHVFEDGTLTKAQFMQCMTVVAFIVDEQFPHLMKLLYGGEPPQTEPGNEEPTKDCEPEDQKKMLPDPTNGGHSLN